MTSESARRVARRVLPALTIVLLLAAVIGIGSGKLKKWFLNPGGSLTIDSLAVLPLANLSGDPSQEYFADGMTDALISDLAKVGALRVISRTSAMHYKHTNKRLPDIARELNVSGIIEGSVLRSGNRVRITAELIQATTDQHLWTESYERDLGDVLKLQSEVAQAIAQQVRVQLTPQQKTVFELTKTVNPDAYEAYLQGRSLDDGTLRGITQAQKYFEQSIQKDSGFALAYAGLADSYLELGSFRFIPPQDAYRQGKKAIRKALELDQNLAEAHAVLGSISWQYDWDWNTAEKEFRYAIQLKPSFSYGHAVLAWFLGWQGRRDEALDEVAISRKLDAANPFTYLNEAGVFYHLRDYPNLLEVSRKSVALTPDVWIPHYYMAVGYEGINRPSEAIPQYEKAVELSQGDTDALAGLAHAFATAGQRAKAQAILQELQGKSAYVSSYMVATVYSGLGDRERAFEYLERALRERSTDLPYFIKADLRLDSLRSDSRYADLLHRIGLSQ